MPIRRYMMICPFSIVPWKVTRMTGSSGRADRLVHGCYRCSGAIYQFSEQACRSPSKSYYGICPLDLAPEANLIWPKRMPGQIPGTVPHFSGRGRCKRKLQDSNAFKAPDEMQISATGKVDRVAI